MTSDFVETFAQIFPIIFLFGLGLIPAFIARNKGYSFLGFYLFGIVAFLIALIVILCLEDKNRLVYKSEMDAKIRETVEQTTEEKMLREFEHPYCQPDCPVDIIALKWTEKAGVQLLKITLKNDSEKAVESVYIKLECMDEAGMPAAAGDMHCISFPLPGLAIAPKSVHTASMSFSLSRTARIKPKIERIRFAEGSEWIACHEPVFMETPLRQSDEKAELMRRMYGCQPDAIPTQYPEYWLCKCGRANPNDCYCCMRCGKEKPAAL